MKAVIVRQLGPNDAAGYRDIRLEALRLSPEAFGSTFEAECSQPIEAFAERLGSSTVFAAMDGEKLIGMAGLAIQDGLKRQHKGTLWGMYVRPEARGHGAGRALVEAVIAEARQRVEVLQLSVVSDNGARHLYAACGFVEYGVELKSLKHGGRYFDQRLMALDLAGT
jgi:ribosomal protein S18 acetylase RimI-like enzyme